jgi:hypothetical protein
MQRNQRFFQDFNFLLKFHHVKSSPLRAKWDIKSTTLTKKQIEHIFDFTYPDDFQIVLL